MYGLLLMTALSTGGDTASFGGRFSGCYGSSCTGAVVVASCYGCSGCTGYTASCSGCSGYTYGCTGSSCNGGGLFSGLRAHFAKHSSCNGSSCYSSSCCGGACYSSSCCGGYGSSCCGGWGACYGNSCCGGSVIYGTAPAASAYYYGTSTWSAAPVVIGQDTVVNHQPRSAQLNANSQALNAGWWANAPRSYGVNYSGVYYTGQNYAAWPNGGVGVRTFSPGYTFGGGYATGVVGPYFYGADHRPYVAQGPVNGTLANPLYGQSPEFQAAKATPDVAAPCKLTVELPADAKFFVDGQLTKGEGTQRMFHTPELPHGKTFFYDLKAEITVDGKVVVENKRVLVRGGEQLSESFPKLIAAAKTGSSKEPTVVATTK
jgi:uncharacterized protein (TIGR03000 family)